MKIARAYLFPFARRRHRARFLDPATSVPSKDDDDKIVWNHTQSCGIVLTGKKKRTGLHWKSRVSHYTDIDSFKFKVNHSVIFEDEPLVQHLPLDKTLLNPSAVCADQSKWIWTQFPSSMGDDILSHPEAARTRRERRKIKKAKQNSITWVCVDGKTPVQYRLARRVKPPGSFCQYSC
jgi:hypothetical protein